MKRIIVIGYYGHNNIGDEQYKLTMPKLFDTIYDKFEMTFIDCDSLKKMNMKDPRSRYDLYVVGGGDILSPYFMNTIIDKFVGLDYPLIAVSVGVPYTSILETGQLNIFDHIFLRTHQDISLISRYHHSVHYITDTSIFLNNFVIDKINISYSSEFLSRPIIIINLIRTIYNLNYQKEYDDFVNNIILFVDYLVHNGYSVVLLPFCSGSFLQDDRIINNEIFEKVINKKFVINSPKLTIVETYNIFKIARYAICMRYHACCFALYNQIPLLVLSTTRKTYNLARDLKLNNIYILKQNDIGIPIEMYYSVLVHKFNTFNTKNTSMDIDIDILDTDISIVKKPFIKKNSIMVHNRYIKHVWSILKELATENFSKEDIVKFTSYYLTNNLNSVYNYGLLQKMFVDDYNYSQEFKYIIEDQIRKNFRKNLHKESPMINLSYIDQNDMSDVHRAGWQYTLKNIKNIDSPNENFLLDFSVDRTFHWDFNVLKKLEIVPYKSPWIGVIHHTFNEVSKFNCHNLFKNECFLESLKCCRVLIVLSEYLKKDIVKALEKVSINIPVRVLCHPTEFTNIKFSMSSLMINESRKLLHIGSWLRNIYSFYELDLSRKSKKSILNKCSCTCINNINKINKTELGLTKHLLVSKHMSNYYPNDDFLKDLKNFLTCNSKDQPISNVCPCIENVWYKHFYDGVLNNVESVNVLPYKNNTEYDILLSENIVFLNLFDASAVNTIIECIVRSTPIIINKIEPVVELLGPKYPLYYNDLLEVPNLLTYSKIKKAHEYLKKMNLDKFNVLFFKEQLLSIIKEFKE
jgi:polysaccharide pyruvyl transferase WcaK-like protein